MRDDLVYLQHSADAIADIEKYTAGGKQDFFDKKIIQDAVIRNLEIIGEAVKNISPAIRIKYTEVPWKQIAGLRDILIHQYFGVDPETVWLVVKKRLPVLAERIHFLLTHE
ncbi:MAG: DUF86 domain-containing protein [Desulfobulbaceae bacterium]|nr:DUF86 domain-containing protein [Desulfobulbaceae bacterium]